MDAIQHRFSGGLMPYNNNPPSPALFSSIFKSPSRIIQGIKAFVSPTGQYYVKTPSGVRIDCHNIQTARYYVENGILVSVAVAAHKAAQTADFAIRRRVNA